MPRERSQFVQKAKLDRIAYEAADLLSRGDTITAATLIGEAGVSVGKKHLKIWLRHYAITRFKMASRAVDDFLSAIQAANVA